MLSGRTEYLGANAVFSSLESPVLKKMQSPVFQALSCVWLLLLVKKCIYVFLHSLSQVKHAVPLSVLIYSEAG